MKRNHWYVVTGGPCSGKTTLLQYLEKIGYAVKYEAARQLIDAELKKGKTLAAIRKNEQKFQKKVLHMKVNQESKLPTQQLFFFERGIPDSIAYYQLCGIHYDVTLQQYVRNCWYRKVFILNLLNYEQDYARTENVTQVKRLDKLLEKSYADIGMSIQRIPALTVVERAELIIRSLT